MALSQGLKNYAAALAAVLVLDLLWIGLIANKFYRTSLGDLARVSDDGALRPLLTPALVVYLLIPLGLVVFVVPRVMEEDSLLMGSAKWGASFGAVLYGVYELTNYSILKGYSLKMVIVDWAWGSALCWAVSAATALFQIKFSDGGGGAPLADYAQF